MSQNGQTHLKNLAAFAATFLKCVWPFQDIIHESVKISYETDKDVTFVKRFLEMI